MRKIQSWVTDLEPRHLQAFDQAEKLIFHADFCPYLELKAMLPVSSDLDRTRFCILFTNYYGLNTGGLTEKFKDTFFDLLFAGVPLAGGKPDFQMLFKSLSRIKSRTGRHALHLSFVSKLVAMHREDSPIYDRHVVSFFRAKVPPATVAEADRIKWFRGFLDHVAKSYAEWTQLPEVERILARLKDRDRHSELARCHPVRLMDFLVWKVGNAKLLNGD